MNNMVVANGQFFGGGMKIAPKAAPTDGLLDIGRACPQARAVAFLPRSTREHLPHPDILEASRNRVLVTADRPLQWAEANSSVKRGSVRGSRDIIRLKV